ncbi:MAG: Fic family protein [Deltaproteobacteria bacterium]|nr:Fic family protein [Deltaproteobacteria bacterium]
MEHFFDNDFLKEINDNYQLIAKHRPFESPEMTGKLRSFYDTALVWSSNALEGFTFSLCETDMLISDCFCPYGKTFQEACAVIGLYNAVKYMYTLAKKSFVTEMDICEFHKFLTGSLANNSIPGLYRTQEVRILNSAYDFPPAKEVPAKLDECYNFLEHSGNKHHPVIFAALARLKFVLIHPFADGDGRVSRLIMNTILIQNGYFPVIISPASKYSYNQTLERSRKDLGYSFVEFISSCESRNQKDFIRFMEFNQSLQEDDIELSHQDGENPIEQTDSNPRGTGPKMK